MIPFLLATLLAGTPAPPPAPPPPAEAPPADPNAPVIEAVEPGLWRITVQCVLGPDPAPGSVTVRLDAAPDPYALPHTGLARARACQSVAAARRAKKDYVGAVSAARAAIEALGQDYATPGATDPTKLDLRQAEDAMGRGSPMQGADLYLKVAAARIGLYQERYAGALGPA